MDTMRSLRVCCLEELGLFPLFDPKLHRRCWAAALRF